MDVVVNRQAGRRVRQVWIERVEVGLDVDRQFARALRHGGGRRRGRGRRRRGGGLGWHRGRNGRRHGSRGGGGGGRGGSRRRSGRLWRRGWLACCEHNQ